MDWRKRGTAEGFSSVNFVMPLLMMSCWFKHGILTNDRTNMFINGVNMIFFTLYIGAFWFYQPKRVGYLPPSNLSLGNSFPEVFIWPIGSSWPDNCHSLSICEHETGRTSSGFNGCNCCRLSDCFNGWRFI